MTFYPMTDQISNSSPKITPFFSEKIKVISFLSIMIVLYIHAGYPDEVNITMKIPVVVRTCIVGIFGPCAVPMFYAISGYLFFFEANDIQRIYKKMKKRIRTLIIPFVLAALFFPLFFIMMEFVPIAAEHINSNSYIEKFSTMPTLKILMSLFYDSGNGMPWAYHLWFMRDLIIIVALSPLLYYLRRWTSYWIIAIVLVLFLLFPQVKILYAMYWFVAGSFVMDILGKLSRRIVIIMFAGFLLLAICRQIYAYDVWKHFRIVEISLGISSIWCLYDFFVSEKYHLVSTPLLNTACKFTFFLYLYHEPGFHIIVKGIPLVLGDKWFGYTMSFLLSPIIMAPIGIGIGSVIKKYFPAMYGIIVGGR